VGRRGGRGDVFKALCGRNVLELLLEMLRGWRLVFRIRLRGTWRASGSGKNVADETVMMIHKTQRESRLSSDRSRERLDERDRGRWRRGERGGMKGKGDFFHFRVVDSRPGLVEPTRRHFPDSGFKLFFFLSFRETKRETHTPHVQPDKTCSLPNCHLFVVL